MWVKISSNDQLMIKSSLETTDDSLYRFSEKKVVSTNFIAIDGAFITEGKRAGSLERFHN